MTLTLIIIIALLSTSIAANAQQATPQAYELTSRGTISEKARDNYKQAIERCHRGPPGRAPYGPLYETCLKQQASESSTALNAVYSNSINVLKASPQRAARLRSTQKTWQQFRDANCEFARLAAPTGSADEFFYDCVLRSAIERAAELSSLVGD